MEQLNAASFPVAIRLCIIALISREAADPSRVGLQLLSESGNQRLFSGPVDINFNQMLSARAILDLQGFVVPSPGLLRFSLRNGEETLSTWEIVVNQIDQARMQIHFPMPPNPAPNPAGPGNQ
jgi:hypothetical protein